MTTRAVLIAADPTPWDVEGRIVGSLSLPLTAEALDAIRHLLDALPGPVNGVYCPTANEACKQAGQLIGLKFGLRPRNKSELDGVQLGLWEGLTPDEVRLRFPTVFPQWQEQPLSVTPPDGEPLEAAIERIRGGLRGIFRRNRGLTVALPMRPMAMQIAVGVLRLQADADIAAGLHRKQPMETIEIDPTNLKAFLS